MSSAFLKEAPFVRLIFPVVVGIIVHNQWPYWSSICWIVLLLLCITGYVLTYKISTARKAQLQPLTGVVISAIILGFSVALSHFHQQRNHAHYVQESDSQRLHIRVLDDPILKGRFYKTKAKVLSQNNKPARGTVMAYLEISETIPAYGDEVIVDCKLSTIESIKNPYEFDYKRYLFHQNIDHQCFARFRNWKVVDSNKGNILFRWSYDLKHNIEREMGQHFRSEAHIAMLKALLLGDKTGIDGELKSGFTQTGTMHVMAVSGLHVGIVFAFMNGFLGLFFRNKWKLIGTIVSLLSLWFFALITGFSPSVSRACFMFSILAIGTQFNRNASVYNSISCAAFFLLIINPSSLFNVGFQFSFLAVIGIVSLQKPLRRLVKTRSWFLSKLLDLTAVSVAAQLATLPLGLFYFGQFPVLFFLSNLLVIPAITVILYAGLCFILLSKISMVAGIFAWVLKVYLWFIIKTVESFQSIPNSFIDNIFVTRVDVIFLVVIIVSLGLLLVGNVKKKALPVLLMACITLVTNQTVRRYKNHYSAEIVQFDLGKKTCMVFRAGSTVSQLGNTEISSKDWQFHCAPYLVSRGVNSFDLKPQKNKVSALINDRDTFRVDEKNWNYAVFQRRELFRN